MLAPRPGCQGKVPLSNPLGFKHHPLEGAGCISFHFDLVFDRCLSLRRCFGVSRNVWSGAIWMNLWHNESLLWYSEVTEFNKTQNHAKISTSLNPSTNPATHKGNHGKPNPMKQQSPEIKNSGKLSSSYLPSLSSMFFICFHPFHFYQVSNCRSPVGSASTIASVFCWTIPSYGEQKSAWFKKSSKVATAI